MRHLRKQVLVTGGAGFLGSHLCQALVAEGDDVLCVDNYYTGQKTNIEHRLGKPNFELLRHDITLRRDAFFRLPPAALPDHQGRSPVSKPTRRRFLEAWTMIRAMQRNG